ncbi:MAG: biotin/lipoyl-binding protein, partial [Pseudomonas sp.]|nr:biotin/lipoyl-binding protein [Pseudomonas sp.]
MELSPSIRSYFSKFGQSKPDTEFMPEVDGSLLEDSPKLTRITVWLTSLLLISALVWAKFAVLEEVTMGEGKAIPSSKIQIIQNLEGGIVAEIFVREGQLVDKGDVLLRLD